MTYTLICDPSHGQQLHLILHDETDQVLHELTIETPRGDQVLPAIAEFLNHERVTQKPSQIVVVNQAESFTFIRIVATVCNTLAYTSGMQLFTVHTLGEKPVACQYIVPHYSAEPNISSPKQPLSVNARQV